MFSKFDINIQSDELASYEPTQADWEEFAAWADEQDAIEELAALEDELYEHDPNPYPQEPWEDDYSDLDPVDMYGAEWENYALRDWD